MASGPKCPVNGKRIQGVLSDLPSSLRFDILMALIRNSELSSMVNPFLVCCMYYNTDEFERCRPEQKEFEKACPLN